MLDIFLPRNLVHNQIERGFFPQVPRRLRGEKFAFPRGLTGSGEGSRRPALLGYGDGTASAWVGPRWEHSGYINLATLWGCLKLNDSGVHSLVPAAAVTLIYGAAPRGFAHAESAKAVLYRRCVHLYRSECVHRRRRLGCTVRVMQTLAMGRSSLLSLA